MHFPILMPLPKAEPVNQPGVQESPSILKWEITVILKHAHTLLDSLPFK